MKKTQAKSIFEAFWTLHPEIGKLDTVFESHVPIDGVLVSTHTGWELGFSQELLYAWHQAPAHQRSPQSPLLNSVKVLFKPYGWDTQHY